MYITLSSFIPFESWWDPHRIICTKSGPENSPPKWDYGSGWLTYLRSICTSSCLGVIGLWSYVAQLHYDYSNCHFCLYTEKFNQKARHCDPHTARRDGHSSSRLLTLFFSGGATPPFRSEWVSLSLNKNVFLALPGVVVPRPTMRTKSQSNLDREVEGLLW